MKLADLGGQLKKSMNQIRLRQIRTTKRKCTEHISERKRRPEKRDFQDELKDLRHTITAQ